MTLSNPGLENITALSCFSKARHFLMLGSVGGTGQSSLEPHSDVGGGHLLSGLEICLHLGGGH